MMDMLDVVVVGGGPSGIAFRHLLSEYYPSLKVELFERSPTLASFSNYPNVTWHSKSRDLIFTKGEQVPRLDWDESWSTKQYSTYLQNWAEVNSVEGKCGRYVESVRLEGKTFLLSITAENQTCTEVYSRFLVLASGLNPMQHPRKDLPWNYHINSTVCEKSLLVTGGGSSAVDAILVMLPQNKIFWTIRSAVIPQPHVHIEHVFHRVLNKYRENLCILPQSNAINFSDDKVLLDSGLTLHGINELYSFIGKTSLCHLTEKLGLMTEGKYLHLNEHYETSVANCFVIGSKSSTIKNGNEIPIYVNNGNFAELLKVLKSIGERLDDEY